ncbi:MAG: hypothetical protein LBQ46_11265 [Treponema sp.]|jgi:hypothetical protein|nr:hypothetical protein [Treponema sp.]
MSFSLRPCSKFLGSILFVTILGAGFSQETSLEELLPELKERAVVLDIISRVVEENQQVVWNSVNSKVTIPGRPVGIKMVGANVVMALQFTPFFRPGGNSFLVAQGQIWVDVPGEGMHYQTTLQTIPIEFGEPIFFFPLGSPNSPQETRIELQLEIRPYTQGGTNRRPRPDSPDVSGRPPAESPPAAHE